MSPAEQRIAIAEACGFTKTTCAAGEIEWTGPKPERRYIGRFSPKTVPSALPKYESDLNAMHEAEKELLNIGDWSMCDYDQELSAMTSGWKWNATAAQRAEAFLRTIGKWVES